MESNSEKYEAIIRLLTEVIKLLNENGLKNRWGIYLGQLLEEFKSNPDKREPARSIMRCMLGGMGSLSDVVFSKDGKMLIEENDSLHAKLSELYERCEDLM